MPNTSNGLKIIYSLEGVPLTSNIVMCTVNTTPSLRTGEYIYDRENDTLYVGGGDIFKETDYRGRSALEIVSGVFSGFPDMGTDLKGGIRVPRLNIAYDENLVTVNMGKQINFSKINFPVKGLAFKTPLTQNEVSALFNISTQGNVQWVSNHYEIKPTSISDNWLNLSTSGTSRVIIECEISGTSILAITDSTGHLITNMSGTGYFVDAYTLVNDSGRFVYSGIDPNAVCKIWFYRRYL